MIDTQAIRNKILDLAIRGQLTEQLPEDGTAEELFQKIQVEKQALINNGKIKKEKAFSESPVFKPYPFDIPKSWKFVRFGELMINRDSERIPVSVADRRKRKKLYDYYGASGVIDGIDDFLFDKDLLLIGEDGANLLARSSPIAFIASGKYWVNNHAHVLDVCSGIDIRYICRYINAISLEKFVTGSAQPKMNQENMNAIWVALPPYDEQQRIVDKIDQTFSVLDTIDTLQTQYADNLTALKAKLIDAAIQGKLTEQLPEDGTTEELYARVQKDKTNILRERKGRADKNIKEVGDDVPYDIPAHWKWIRFGELGLFKKGPFGSALTKSMFVPKGSDTIKVYEQQHAIRKDSTLGTYYITKQYFDEKMNGFEVKPGDILISCAGTIGETYVMPDDIEQGIINQALMRVTLVPGINKKYFQYYFDSNLKSSAREGNGSAIVNIPPFDVIKNWYFPLAPIEEQERIVTRLEEVFAEMKM